MYECLELLGAALNSFLVSMAHYKISLREIVSEDYTKNNLK
jgi:hypothetical protein